MAETKGTRIKNAPRARQCFAAAIEASAAVEPRSLPQLWDSLASVLPVARTDGVEISSPTQKVAGEPFDSLGASVKAVECDPSSSSLWYTLSKKLAGPSNKGEAEPLPSSLSATSVNVNGVAMTKKQCLLKAIETVGSSSNPAAPWTDLASLCQDGEIVIINGYFLSFHQATGEFKQVQHPISSAGEWPTVLASIQGQLREREKQCEEANRTIDSQAQRIAQLEAALQQRQQSRSGSSSSRSPPSAI